MPGSANGLEGRFLAGYVNRARGYFATFFLLTKDVGGLTLTLTTIKVKVKKKGNTSRKCALPFVNNVAGVDNARMGSCIGNSNLRSRLSRLPAILKTSPGSPRPFDASATIGNTFEQ
jgi:hypothetical protein